MVTCSELYLEQCIVIVQRSFKICDTVISVHPEAALWVEFVSDTVAGRPRSGSLRLRASYHLARECDGW